MSLFQNAVNYKRCFLIGLLFQIFLFLLSNSLVWISRGYFPLPQNWQSAVIFASYLIFQGFFSALVVVLFFDKLPIKKFKAGMIVGVFILFFNNQLVILVSEVVSIIYAINNNLLGLNILLLTELALWLALILIYLLSGLVLVLLISKFYQQRQIANDQNSDEIDK